MKRIALATLGLMLLALLPRMSLSAQETGRVVVLPPDVYGDRDLAGLRSGLADLLASKIAAGGQLEVATPASVETLLGEQAGKPLDDKGVDRVAKALEAKAVVWGSLTTLGRSTSVVLKLTVPGDQLATRHFSAIASGPDDVLAKLGALGDQIRVALGAGAGVPEAVRPTPEARISPPPAPAPPAAASTAPAAPAAPAVTPTAVARSGELFPFQGSRLWTSDELPFGVRGMAVGDVDGDGKNEVVLIDTQNLYVYRLNDRSFALLATAKGKSYEDYIAVGLAEGVPGAPCRIFVTSMRDGPRSTVWEYRGGALTPVLDDIRLFLRSVEAGSGREILGQGMETKGWPYRGDVVRVDVRGSGAPSGAADLPKGFSLYHFARADLKGEGKQDYVAVDGEGQLLLYSASKDFLWQGMGGYQESCVSWQRARRENDADSAEQDTYRVPPALVAADLAGDGVQELLAVRNPSQGWARFLPGFGSSGARIDGLRWEKGRLTQVGTIEGVSGCIVGIAWADVTGGGSRNLLAASVVNPSATVEGLRSVLHVYSKE